ncbi:MAG: YdeI/OmpD-associated family protein [Bacteroidetes bacterium]|nr:YdeI/OmpD-associated family protein [Bacteroidota bacterium]MCB9225672.1 YdeI/OmpD-associated family protein [Chitinophagales bacterium]
MSKKEHHKIIPGNTKEWREWLTQNHIKEDGVWLIYYKKNADKPTISWSEAVDEALCFGWIDSVKKPIDEEKFMQFFSKRKANSLWSKINKEKVSKLTQARKMTPAGFEIIEKAKQNGMWTLLDEVEELIIPKDLQQAFDAKPKALNYFLSLSKSVKKGMLTWIVVAKREETRQNRINEIVSCATNNKKPKHFG